MARLKEIFNNLGFTQVETFIASGNVLFRSRTRNRRTLEKKICRGLEKELGYPVDTFVRTAKEVIALDQAKVFHEEGKAGITVHVGFLHDKLSPTIAKRLAAIRTETDEFRVQGRDYYWLCRTRVSDSRVWSSAEMKALKLPTSSARSVTTIRKLVAKHFA